MTRPFALALALALALAGAVSAQDPDLGGGSLYQRDADLYRPHPDGKDGVNRSVYSDIRPDPVVWEKHDLVTILVLERARSRVQAETEIEKSIDLDASLDQFIRFRTVDRTTNNPFDRFSLENTTPNHGIDFSAEYERENSGETSRRGELLEKITAEVVKVLPNRNLVIEARKVRRVNDETETLVLSGIVRADDVRTDNTVESEKIARLTIEYTGSGDVNNGQKAGWLAKAFEWIYPF